MYSEEKKILILLLYTTGFTYESIALHMNICKAKTKNKRGAVHELLKRWGLLEAARTMRLSYLSRVKRHTEYRSAIINRSDPTMKHIKTLHCSDIKIKRAVGFCAETLPQITHIKPEKLTEDYRKRWYRKAANARKNNIPFSLDFDRFVLRCRTQGIEPEQFGRGKDDYVIGREHFIGEEYSNTTFIIQTKSTNSREGQFRSWHQKKKIAPINA